MSKTSTLLKAASFAAGLAIPTIAQAQSYQYLLDWQCNWLRLPCIQDQRKANVGLSDSYEVLKRPFNGKWYLVFNDSDGFQNNTMFFYAHSNCSGQPYIAYRGELPVIVLFDGGTTFWGPGSSHAVTKLNAWSLQGAPNPTAAGACSSYGEDATFDTEAAEAIVIDTNANQFHPPFSAKVNNW
jgi:hypothetical protein